MGQNFELILEAAQLPVDNAIYSAEVPVNADSAAPETGAANNSDPLGTIVVFGLIAACAIVGRSAVKSESPWLQDRNTNRFDPDELFED